MNNCKKNKGRIKKGGYKTGRGYSGWYMNNDRKKLFLRSKNEFIYAKYLDKCNKHFLTEKMSFNIDNITYKPDFFIYTDNTYSKIEKIIEVKQSQDIANNYLKMFKQYFMSIGIEYDAVFDLYKNYVKNGPVQQSEINVWIEKYVTQYQNIDMRGEKNPMFNVKHKKETKEKIGLRTTEYMKDPIIKARHREGIKNFWKSEKGKKAKKMLSKLRKQDALARKSLFELNNPILVKKCIICNAQFKTRDKEVLCCSINNSSCKHKHNWATGNYTYVNNSARGSQAYATKIKNYLKLVLAHEQNINELNYNDIIRKYKAENLIPKHIGMNLKVIEKYFSTLDNIIGELK